MKRRLLFGLSLTLVLGTLSFGAWLLTRPASLATEDNVSLIKEGMTRADVESILGKPDIFEFSGKLTNETADFASLMLTVNNVRYEEDSPATLAIAIWIARDKYFAVSLSDDYKVNGATTFTMPQPTLTERIRSWFRL